MSKPSQSYIKVSTQFEALHHWPEAPEPEGYLRHLHRHLFTIDVRIDVTHDDRELEINQVKRFIDMTLSKTVPGMTETEELPSLGSQSCEMIAEYVTKHLIKRYGERRIQCEVLEDGQLGGGFVWTPQRRLTDTPSQPITPDELARRDETKFSLALDLLEQNYKHLSNLIWPVSPEAAKQQVSEMVGLLERTQAFLLRHLPPVSTFGKLKSEPGDVPF